MTRWARSKSSHQHQKQPEEPTPWAEFGVISRRNKQKQANNKVAQPRKTTSEKSAVPDSCNDAVMPRLEKASCTFKDVVTKPVAINNTSIAGGVVSNDTDGCNNSNIAAQNVDIIPRKRKKRGKRKRSLTASSHVEATDVGSSIETIKGQTSSSEVTCLASQLAEDDIGKSNQDKDCTKKVEAKKNYVEHLQCVRNEKGILLLPPKVERKIYLLKKGMRKRKISGAEIRQAVRRMRRIEELKYRKELKMVCFHCRKPGHALSECPVAKQDTEHGAGLCFRCGSTEHNVSKCPVPSKSSDDYPFAKCFICKQQGHLSRTCPSNPLGLYPKGGKCRQCGAKDHLQRDCPDLKPAKKKREDNIAVDRIIGSASADAEPVAANSPTPTTRHSKVVIF